MAYSEVEEVDGYVGNFKVKVRKKARYVREEDCNSCAECGEVCPVVVPDEFQMGLSSRKAVYLPFPQAVPASYIIDMEACLGTNPIACGKCEEVCEKVCIDYDMKDEIFELEVGVVVVATGMDVYDPHVYGVRAADLRQRRDGGPLRPPLGPRGARAHRVHPVRGLAQQRRRQR
jgi:heterodisulfide reductase subunit A